MFFFSWRGRQWFTVSSLVSAAVLPHRRKSRRIPAKVPLP